jgi:hypothetical protein
MKIIRHLLWIVACAGLVSCLGPRQQIAHTNWGRCGELKKDQYYGTNSIRHLEKEVFYGFDDRKMMEVRYFPPIVELRTFDRSGKVIQIDRRNLSDLAHADKGRPHFDLLYFPVVSQTQAGYFRVDYFDHIDSNPNGDPDLDTVVYFHKDKYPEDPFDKIRNGMTRQETEDLAGKPVISEANGTRGTYYSGIYEVTIAFEHDKVVSVRSEVRKKYQ